MKVCFKCKQPKAAKDFSPDTRRADGLSSYCKVCKNIISRALFALNPELGRRKYQRRVELHGLEAIRRESRERKRKNPVKRLGAFRKWKYGISPEQVQQLLAGQNNKCAICQAAPPTHLDHDHKLGITRGMLCAACNQGLGFFKDSADSLEAAAAYLRGFYGLLS
jgi:hypothetical protein